MHESIARKNGTDVRRTTPDRLANTSFKANRIFDRTVASAVVLPEPSEIVAQPEPPSLKRRQSSIESNSAKRPRLSTSERWAQERDSRSPPPPQDGHSSDNRRRSSVRGGGAVEERKRGQRLFGAILGTLAQTSPSAGQRRRAEIEKKQQVKLLQKDEEGEVHKRQRRNELLAVRRREQRVWDEEGMRIRHGNMMVTARYLKTKAEPILYYKPWDLRPEEEEAIQRQASHAQAIVDRERAEFEERRRREDETEAERAQTEVRRLESQEETPDLDGGDGTSDRNDLPPNRELDGATRDDTQATQDAPELNGKGSTEPHDHAMPDDHGGEELVEGQEDDLIY